MIIAALGQRTERIRLGPAVSVLPLRHPLLVAEEYALADNLCGGRLNFAIGSGFSPVEYKTFGMSRRANGRRAPNPGADVRGDFSAN